MASAVLRRLLTFLSGRLVTRSMAGLVVRAIEVIGKLALYVLVAHRLGASEAGLYFVAMTWVTLGSSLSRLGLERALMRHLPAELGVGHGAAARNLLVWTLIWTAASAVLVGGATMLLAHPLADVFFHKPEFGMPLVLSAAILVPDALAITAGSGLIGMKRPVAALLVQNTLWPLLTFAAVWFGPDQVHYALLATAVCRLLPVLVALGLLWAQRRQFGAAAGPAPGRRAFRGLPGEFWRTAMPLFVVELVQGMTITIPILVLGAFVDNASVGAFSAANRLSMLTWTVLVGVSTVVSPHFSEAYHVERWNELRTVNRTARLTAAAAALPPLILMLLVPHWLLELVGPGFGIADTALRILVIGQMINALMACQDVLLAMTGHGRTLRMLNLLQLATCLTLSATAIPLLGIIGAAVLMGLVTAQGGVGSMIAARRLVPQAF